MFGGSEPDDEGGIFWEEGGVRVFTTNTWDAPWVWKTGTGWRADIELMVLMHREIGTVIEIQPNEASGFVFKVCSRGDTPHNTPGNTPRLPNKIKRCGWEGYIGDWRFNGANGKWKFTQRDPQEAARQMFRSFDTDGGGTMDADEIKEAARAMGFLLNENELKIPEGGVNLDGFLEILNIQDPEICMVLSVVGNDMELWLTNKGFIFLSASHKNEALVVQGGACPDYTVPKLEAWQFLPKADQALKQADAWKLEKLKEEEAMRLEEEARMAAEKALTRKQDEEEAKRRRRALREQGMDPTLDNMNGSVDHRS